MKLFSVQLQSKLLVVLLFSLISAQAYSAIVSFEFDNARQERLFYDLTKQLRCPKCQNQNILDSNAQLAKDLRNKTYELLKQGKSEQQIIDYMVARFGNFVRYDPPVTPATIFLWLAPLAIVLLGFYFLLAQINKQNKVEQQFDMQESKRLQKILDASESQAKQGSKL